MSFFASDLALPLMRRGFGYFGMYLLGLGISEDTTATITAGLTALGGVAVDLILSHKNRTD